MLQSIAVLSAEFPAHWHTYIVSQSRDFEALGVRTRHLSTRLPKAEFLSPDILAKAGGEVGVLFPPKAEDILRIALKPGWLMGMLSYLRTTREGGAKGFLRRLLLMPSVAALIREAAQSDAQLVLLHSFGDAAHVAAMAERCAGLPYALTLHGPLSVWGGDIGPKTRRATRIFPVTKALLKELEAACPEVPATAISMGVDLDSFPFISRPRRDPGAPLRIATIARLHASKGHGYVLEAVRSLLDQGVDVRYLIAGNGPNEPEIRARIAELGLGDAVQLLGAISGAQVAELLAETDAVVLASVGEGEAAPVSVMEAMARGVPVICTRIGGTPEMIEDGVDGFLAPQQDAEAIARALRTLAAAPDLAAEMSGRAHAKAAAQFDTATLSAQALDLLSADLARKIR